MKSALEHQYSPWNHPPPARVPYTIRRCGDRVSPMVNPDGNERPAALYLRYRASSRRPDRSQGQDRRRAEADAVTDSRGIDLLSHPPGISGAQFPEAGLLQRLRRVGLVGAARGSPRRKARSDRPAGIHDDSRAQGSDPQDARRLHRLQRRRDAGVSARGVGARILTRPRSPIRRARYRPMRYDAGRPSSVSRFRMLHAPTASRRCPA